MFQGIVLIPQYSTYTLPCGLYSTVLPYIPCDLYSTVLHTYLVICIIDGLVEIQKSVGSKTNGSDYWMVEWTILVRLNMENIIIPNTVSYT